MVILVLFFFSRRRGHTRLKCDWSSDVCFADLFTVFAVGPDSENREQITVRMVAGRWTGTAIARRAEVSTGLQRSPWQLRGFRIAGIDGKLGNIRRDVHHQPGPEPAARGRIRIEASDGEALRADGWPRPRHDARSACCHAA